MEPPDEAKISPIRLATTSRNRRTSQNARTSRRRSKSRNKAANRQSCLGSQSDSWSRCCCCYCCCSCQSYCCPADGRQPHCSLYGPLSLPCCQVRCGHAKGFGLEVRVPRLAGHAPPACPAVRRIRYSCSDRPGGCTLSLAWDTRESEPSRPITRLELVGPPEDRAHLEEGLTYRLIEPEVADGRVLCLVDVSRSERGLILALNWPQSGQIVGPAGHANVLRLRLSERTPGAPRPSAGQHLRHLRARAWRLEAGQSPEKRAEPEGAPACDPVCLVGALCVAHLVWRRLGVSGEDSAHGKGASGADRAPAGSESNSNSSECGSCSGSAASQWALDSERSESRWSLGSRPAEAACGPLSASSGGSGSQPEGGEQRDTATTCSSGSSLSDSGSCRVRFRRQRSPGGCCCGPAGGSRAARVRAVASAEPTPRRGRHLEPPGSGSGSRRLLDPMDPVWRAGGDSARALSCTEASLVQQAGSLIAQLAASARSRSLCTESLARPAASASGSASQAQRQAAEGERGAGGPAGRRHGSGSAGLRPKLSCISQLGSKVGRFTLNAINRIRSRSATHLHQPGQHPHQMGLLQEGQRAQTGSGPAEHQRAGALQIVPHQLNRFWSASAAQLERAGQEMLFCSPDGVYLGPGALASWGASGAQAHPATTCEGRRARLASADVLRAPPPVADSAPGLGPARTRNSLGPASGKPENSVSLGNLAGQPECKVAGQHRAAASQQSARLNASSQQLQPALSRSPSSQSQRGPLVRLRPSLSSQLNSEARSSPRLARSSRSTSLGSGHASWALLPAAVAQAGPGRSRSSMELGGSAGAGGQQSCLRLAESVAGQWEEPARPHHWHQREQLLLAASAEPATSAGFGHQPQAGQQVSPDGQAPLASYGANQAASCVHCQLIVGLARELGAAPENGPQQSALLAGYLAHLLPGLLECETTKRVQRVQAGAGHTRATAPHPSVVLTICSSPNTLDEPESSWWRDQCASAEQPASWSEPSDELEQELNEDEDEEYDEDEELERTRAEEDEEQDEEHEDYDYDQEDVDDQSFLLADGARRLSNGRRCSSSASLVSVAHRPEPEQMATLQQADRRNSSNPSERPDEPSERDLFSTGNQLDELGFVLARLSSVSSSSSGSSSSASFVSSSGSSNPEESAQSCSPSSSGSPTSNTSRAGQLDRSPAHRKHDRKHRHAHHLLQVPEVGKQARSASLDTPYLLKVPEPDQLEGLYCCDSRPSVPGEPPIPKSSRSLSVDIALPAQPGDAYLVVPPDEAQLDREKQQHKQKQKQQKQKQQQQQKQRQQQQQQQQQQQKHKEKLTQKLRQELHISRLRPKLPEPRASSATKRKTKFIQGEIKVSCANGETQALRLFVDWQKDCVNGEHLWVYAGSSSEACYVGESECLKHGPRLCCSACKITAHTSCISILIDKIKFICKHTFRDLALTNPRHMKELQLQNVIYHHWVHKRNHCGKCKQCTKTFGSTKLPFSSKEIQAITCSWCKVSYHNKENCYSLSALTEPCTLGIHRESIIPPTWILKFPIVRDQVQAMDIASDQSISELKPEKLVDLTTNNPRYFDECNDKSKIEDEKSSQVQQIYNSRVSNQNFHNYGSDATLMTETSGYVSTGGSNLQFLTQNNNIGFQIMSYDPQETGRPTSGQTHNIPEDTSALQVSDLSLINQNNRSSKVPNSYNQDYSNTSQKQQYGKPAQNSSLRAHQLKSGNIENEEPPYAIRTVSGSNGLYQNFRIVPQQVYGVPNAGSKPVLVFVNPRSGGNQGPKMMQKFNWLLNPRQVFDLIQCGGPRAALELYKDVPNLRILTIGGDGTASWILSSLDEVGVPNKIPVAVLPLGTGNDLARALCWGGGYTDEPIAKILAQVRDGEIVQLDRWNLQVERNLDIAPSSPNEHSVSSLAGIGTTDFSSPSLSSSSSYFGSMTQNNNLTSISSIIDRNNCDTNMIHATSNPVSSFNVPQEELGCDKLPMEVINNYFSFGVDAHIALEFHTAREAHPERFSSRLRNKMFYGQAGGKDLLKRKWKDLSNFVTLYCDGQDMTGRLKELKVHSVLFLNIPSYGGGTRPWPTTATSFAKPRTDDGLIEVIGLTTYQLPLLQAGGHGTCIAQCHRAKIITSRTIPMQVDGEPCKLLPSIINISFKNRVCMLAKSKNSSKYNNSIANYTIQKTS